MRPPLALLALAVTLAGMPVKPAAAGTLQLPAATRFTLKNGLSVIVMPTRRLPLVDFRLVVLAGSVRDPEGREGLAGLTAELLTQGAARRSAQQIAEDIAFVGGTLDAQATAEQIVVTCEVLKKDFATGLELFHDVIVSPSFLDEEIKRKRDETVGTIASQRNDPSTVANVALGPFLFDGSRLAHPVLGWEKSVAAITRDDLVRFHAEQVRPDWALLAVVGDVDPVAVRSALERSFADWKAAGVKRTEPYSPPTAERGRRLLVVNKPEVTQTQIRMACMGVPRNHPDYFPIVVANTILGSGFTSRLVNEIRVNQGLTYSIRSRFATFRNAGSFSITTFTKNATLRKTVDATLAEVKKLVDQGPSDDELAKAHRYLTGQFPLGLQAPDALAAQVLDAEFYGLGPSYLETYSDKVLAVTMDDCRRALRSYFCADQLDILVVCDPETAKQALEGLGPVRVEDPR